MIFPTSIPVLATLTASGLNCRKFSKTGAPFVGLFTVSRRQSNDMYYDSFAAFPARASAAGVSHVENILRYPSVEVLLIMCIVT